MAYAQTTDLFGASLIAKLQGAVASYRAASARRAVYLRTYEELNALADADLEDIGIARSQIEEIARTEAAKLG